MGVIYVVCQKAERAGEAQSGRNMAVEKEGIREIEQFFAVANSRIIVSGEVPKEKAVYREQTLWKTGSSLSRIRENEVDTYLALKKKLPAHFVFRNAPVLLKKF